MNTHLKELIELAKNDQAIDSYNPELEAIDKKIARVQKKLTTAQNEFNKLELSIADNEEKIIGFDTQLKLLNQQLIDNTKKGKIITTEKEMKALSVEEELAKEKMTYANEEIDRLQNINNTKKEIIDEVEEKLKTLQEQFNTITEEATIKKSEIEKSKGELFVKREELSRLLEQKVLAFYEKIRIWAGNSAVVPVKKQACYGCYMKLNDKTYSEVIKGDEICNCPHCGRIIYIEPITPEA